jgi:hypothetical protein
MLLSIAAGCAQPSDTPPAETPEPTAEPPKAAISFEGAWSVGGEGMDAPESAYVDPGSGDVFVSLIGGMPTDKDGNGMIARLGIDGSVKAPTWITGLNAPKGLRSHQGTLWVSDIDEVLGIDIKSGKVTSKTRIEGAQFLNDVAIGSDGTVYISDMLGNKIYTLRSGKAAVFAEGEDLENPNGLLVEGNSLVVGGWGKPEADFTTKVPGRLYKINLKTKAKSYITPAPAANIDGIESDGKGNYIISDYLAGKIYRVSSDGKMETVTTFAPSTADIGFAADRNLLIIPHMNEDKVTAYDLASLK